MKKVAIFYHIDSSTWIMDDASMKDDECSFMFYEYNTLAQLYEQFEANYLFFDGILCSGPIPYFFLKRKFMHVKKPIRYFNISKQDFYKKMMLFMYENRQFQFKRIVADFLFQENNYLDLLDEISSEEYPHLLMDSVFSYDEENIYEQLYKKYEAVLFSEDMDYCLTRLPRVAQLFSHANVKILVFTPSVDSMKNTIYELKRDMEIEQLTQNQLVVGIIHIPDHAGELEYQKITVHKLLLDFMKPRHIPAVIQRESFALKLLLSYADFLRITHDQTVCELTAYLREHMTIKVMIGWGVGATMPAATFHAEKAAMMSMKMNETCAYLMAKEDEIIGPLDAKAPLIDEKLSAQFNVIHAETNISVVVLRKMYQALQLQGSYETNATELAQHLNATERTANRYLKKLAENGYCTLVKTRQVKMQGRPKKIYHIHFEQQKEAK